MDLITPAFGLIFWMTLTFGIVLFILSKFAWKPILNSLKEREDSINNSLNSAEEARRQMDQLKSDNELLLNQARAERDSLLKEANEIKDQILNKARKDAKSEGEKMLVAAKQSIQKEKDQAINELKAQVAELAVSMAEKILRNKMEDRAQQEAFVNENLKSISLN